MPERRQRGTYQIAMEIRGTIIGVRKVQDRGRIQIPKQVRDSLGLEDGDDVYWIKWNDRFHIMKAVEIT